MAISSAPKVASKLPNVAAPSIQSLLRPGAGAATASHLFQSLASTTMTVGADQWLFNLPQRGTDRSESATISNIREINLALNSVTLPLGYSAAKKSTSIEAEEEDDFSGEVDEEGLEDFEDIDDDEEEDEDEEEEEEEAPPPRKSRK